MVIQLLRLFCVIVFCLTESMVAAESSPIRVWFDVNHTTFIFLPDDLGPGPFDVEANDKGQVRVARIDLNEDGVLEYFIPGACGKGGCDYPLYDGKSKRKVGDLFGAQLWIVDRTVKGMPVIVSYSPGPGSRGLLVEYEFNGELYTAVGQEDLNEQAVEALFVRLHQSPSVR